MKHKSNKIDSPTHLMLDSEIQAADFAKANKSRQSMSKKGSTLSIQQKDGDEYGIKNQTLALKSVIASRGERHQSALSVGKKDGTEVYKNK